MTEKNQRRLVELSKEITLDNKILEFLELYVILKTETRQFNELEGVVSLKEYCSGVIEARQSAEEGEINV